MIFSQFSFLKFYFVILLLCLPTLTTAQAVVDSTQLMHDLQWMSSDNLQGRRVMTAGNEAAQAYIAAVFERNGLKKFKWADSTISYKQVWRNKRGASELKGANIIGYIEGTEKPQTYMVISAHFDHLGNLNGDVYNGADDNASGACGLLAMIPYFVKNKPKHSIIFAAFDAEEMGLVGARMFIASPPVALEQIAYNLNMDMISRNTKNELFATGTHPYPFLKPFVEQGAMGSKVQMRLGHDTPQDKGSDNWISASDQGAFHAKNIPFIYFGVEDHPDYHKPTDEFQNIMPSFYYQAVTTILHVALKMDENLDTILIHRLEKVAK